jgi:hypothetical protein
MKLVILCNDHALHVQSMADVFSRIKIFEVCLVVTAIAVAATYFLFLKLSCMCKFYMGLGENKLAKESSRPSQPQSMQHPLHVLPPTPDHDIFT